MYLYVHVYMLSRYIAPFAGAPRDTAVMQAIDSRSIISCCLAMVFQHEHSQVACGLGIVAGLSSKAAADVQLAVNVSFGVEPSMAGIW